MTTSRDGWITWLDLETSGLDENECVILEVAVIVTDENLTSMTRLNGVVHYDDIFWPGGENDWARKTHENSGLLKAVAESTVAIDEAEQLVVEFLKLVGKHPMGGNSLHFDRRFLAKHMPRVLDLVHYRHIDVSTITELAKRWRPDLKDEMPKSRELHRGMPDLEDSIEAMKFFRKKLFDARPLAATAVGSAHRRVILESPYAGDIGLNVEYARACMRDSLLRGEAPMASHLLYTQPGVLDDGDPAERKMGIEAGLAWGAGAEASVVYTDLGVSTGMKLGMERAEKAGRPIILRTLGALWGEVGSSEIG